MASVLIISDQPVLCFGFEAVLAAHGFGVVIAPAVESFPDMILLDAAAGLNLEKLSEIHWQMPHCPVVLWTGTIPLELELRPLEFGVRGMVLRSSTPGELVEALVRVASGETQIGFGATLDGAARRRAALTPREKEIVAWLRQGIRNKEIAARMNITEGTVKAYLFRLFQKVGVRNRFELASCGPAAAVSAL